MANTLIIMFFLLLLMQFTLLFEVYAGEPQKNVELENRQGTPVPQGSNAPRPPTPTPGPSPTPIELAKRN